MTRNLPDRPQRFIADAISSRRCSRRSFLIKTASTCGVAAVAAWSPVFARAASLDDKDILNVTIVRYSEVGKLIGKATIPKVVKTEDEWKQKLDPMSFKVTRQFGTERPFTGSTWDNHEVGLYRCICCDNALFSSETKFNSGTGWPSFWQPLAEENVSETVDKSIPNRTRTAVSCRECDAHLGHVFNDGPNPTGLRYCMNSAAMRFIKTA